MHTDYSYFHINSKREDDCLPENTWEDLNLEDFFHSANYTSSRVGEQYLYHLLRTDKQSEASKYEHIIHTLANDAHKRTQLMTCLQKLHHSDAYSIASLFLKPIPATPNWEVKLLSVCRFVPFLLAGLLIVLHSTFVLFPLIISIIGNVFLHYRNKTKIQEYFFSIPQLIKLIQTTEALIKEDIYTSTQEGIGETTEELTLLRKSLSAFKLSIRLESDITFLAYTIAELLNFVFLTEAYKINKAFRVLADKQTQISKAFSFVGFLDVLCSISLWRESLPYYCVPENSNQPDNAISTKGIYHPLIANAVANDFTTNISIIITGSNMSGKTSFIRTVGINLVSAKVLNTCAAKSFSISLNTRLASAIHVSDNLTEGKSYFLQEVEYLSELIAITDNEKSYLLLIDEPFKGTNTIERIAIGKAVLSTLAQKGNLVLASTHDHELVDLMKHEYHSYYFCESVENKLLSFDYKLKKGKATERNAIKILDIFNYPKEVTAEAYRISEQLTARP
ncbi:hypothetical protein LJC21_02965 [Bacteroides sp. OttesenSCG-928-E20]|nr:hypothetical protein [Bacteroides sp. OttesenSCG-928-N06]MDL2299650.1 hypothetical protein [Bacteroides sp. OttesenSCG-928-E20]MDL2304242.1 hypothetical protein [Bacteroides sp. OttesenSCG-928-D19]